MFKKFGRLITRFIRSFIHGPESEPLELPFAEREEFLKRNLPSAEFYLLWEPELLRENGYCSWDSWEIDGQLEADSDPNLVLQLQIAKLKCVEYYDLSKPWYSMKCEVLETVPISEVNNSFPLGTGTGIFWEEGGLFERIQVGPFTIFSIGEQYPDTYIIQKLEFVIKLKWFW